MNARLTRFYERQDWQKNLAESDSSEALLLERGLALSLVQPTGVNEDKQMYQAMNTAKQAAMMLTGRGVKTTQISEMREQLQMRKEQKT